MPPPFCGISATRGYMGEIMLYIRGFRLFPGKSAACFRNCAARSGSPAVPPQAALPSLLIYKEAPCAPEGFCPLTNCPSAHPERSPDPPTGRGYFCRKCTILQCSSSCGIAHCLHTAVRSGFIHLHKRILYFHIVSVFLWMHKNASYYSFSRHKRLNLPNSPHIFCMEAHSFHSYSL